MESKWLEDYLTLIEQGSFTKAAEKRYVTQPAFSRRIRSLEQWLGVELIDRNSFPIRLTEVGQESLHRFRYLLKDIHDLKKSIQALDSRSSSFVLATQASLSVSFCPAWFASLTHLIGDSKIRVVAGDLYDCIEQFLSGHSDILLCYSHDNIIPALTRSDLRRIKLSDDQLIPVCASFKASDFKQKEGISANTFNIVSFTAESFFGQLITEHCGGECKSGNISFNSVIETSLSESVHAHVLAGTGFAWLPKNLVAQDLAAGVLTQLAFLPSLDLEIYLFAHSSTKSNQVVNKLWLNSTGGSL
jgi:DNA-binding transcriptional LysR family regulator